MKTAVPVARRVRAPVSDAWVRSAVEAALRGVGVKKMKEVGVVFVGDAEMKKLNATYRGKKKTTDVLSFGNDNSWKGKGNETLLGDLVISMPQARRQAAKAGRPLKAELAMLVVHGTLHLLGYDHETEKDEKIMMPLQRRVLKKLGYV